MTSTGDIDEDSAPILGFADGPIASSSRDLKDYTISRLGGYPTFCLSQNNVPSTECSKCTECKNFMPLITQIYCPFPDSNYDRVLYVWGCENKTCQKSGKGVRAWRASRWNESFAADAKANENDQKPKENPFAMNNEVSSITNGLGNLLFDSSPFNVTTEESKDTPILPAIPSFQSETWSKAITTPLPSYIPQYLDTLLEPPPPPKKFGPLPPPEADASGGSEWTNEKYERASTLAASKLLSVDDVFVAFQDRVRPFPNQVVRHNFGGTPLAFTGKGATFDILFPIKPGEGEDDEVEDREYDPSNVERCSCGAERVFELQIMPGMEGVWEVVEKEIEDGKKGRGRWEWSTLFIFSCEKECAEKEAWREERVLVQFED